MERKLQQIKDPSISREAAQPPKREILGWKTGTMNSEALRTLCYNCCRFIRELLVCVCVRTARPWLPSPLRGGGLIQSTSDKHRGAVSGEVFPHSSSAREVTPESSGIFLGVGRSFIILNNCICLMFTARFKVLWKSILISQVLRITN